MRRNFFLDPCFEGKALYEIDSIIGDRTIAAMWLSKGNMYRIKKNMGSYRQILSHDGKNATSKLYYKNKNRVARDFEYTLRLEKYTINTLYLEANFDLHKVELLMSSIFLFLFSRKNINYGLIKNIYCSMEFPIFKIIIYHGYLYKKLFRKLREKK